MAPTDSKKATVVTREYTINLHKLLHRETFKERAPKAIKAVRGPGDEETGAAYWHGSLLSSF